MVFGKWFDKFKDAKEDKDVERHAELMRRQWTEKAMKSEYNYVSHLANENDRWDVDEFYLVGSRFVGRGVKWLMDAGASNLNAGRIIEIGCGNGRMTRFLCMFFSHVTAVDISPEMVVLCKKNMENIKNALVQQCNGSDFSNFSDESFDYVWTTGVLQHFTSLHIFGNYLREGIRLLRPGGYFLFQYQGAAVNMGREESNNVMQGCAPTPKQLDEMFRGAQIRIRNYAVDNYSPKNEIVIIVQKDQTANFGSDDVPTFASIEPEDRVWMSDVYNDIRTKTLAKHKSGARRV